MTHQTLLSQGSSLPAQNVYQCRVQEEKAVAASRSARQPDKDITAAAAMNGNQIGPTSSSSMTSFHSQVAGLYRMLMSSVDSNFAYVVKLYVLRFKFAIGVPGRILNKSGKIGRYKWSSG